MGNAIQCLPSPLMKVLVWDCAFPMDHRFQSDQRVPPNKGTGIAGMYLRDADDGRCDHGSQRRRRMLWWATPPNHCWSLRGTQYAPRLPPSPRRNSSSSWGWTRNGRGCCAVGLGMWLMRVTLGLTLMLTMWNGAWIRMQIRLGTWMMMVWTPALLLLRVAQVVTTLGWSIVVDWPQAWRRPMVRCRHAAVDVGHLCCRIPTPAFVPAFVLLRKTTPSMKTMKRKRIPMKISWMDSIRLWVSGSAGSGMRACSFVPIEGNGCSCCCRR
mmetsp:Transcript_15299/g.42314  ORF Transcript_15299/g.42314 Transcript_15299/m.42314 type:complete len:268 (+) Transcript_15299:215-1018(+)